MNSLLCSSYKTLYINKIDGLVWHKRFSHPCEKTLKSIFQKLHRALGFTTLPFCKDCEYGKHHQHHFHNSESKATQPLELIHSDVWGPTLTPSHLGYKYYIHFIDDYTRFTSIFPLRSKVEVLSLFQNFHKYLERQFDKKVKALQIDWRKEYKFLSPYLDTQCIAFRHSCLYTHQQNGRAERKYRHIVELGFILLS